jgi:hypothetical protein
MTFIAANKTVLFYSRVLCIFSVWFHDCIAAAVIIIIIIIVVVGMIAAAIYGINLLADLLTMKAVRCILGPQLLHSDCDKCSAQYYRKNFCF